MSENQAARQCSSFEYSSSGSESIKGNNDSPALNPRFLKSSLNIIRVTSSNKPKKNQVNLSRWMRFILFCILILFFMATDFDSGIIISCYKNFISDLKMTDFQFGSLNSINSTGKIIALVLYMLLIQKNHRKLILALNAIMYGLYFFSYFFITNYSFISILKFIQAFCEIFITIYLPVWVDQFGIKKYKTLFLSFYFMVNTYGRIIGSGLGTIIFKNEWKKAFICCGITFEILALLIIIFPQKYFSTKYMFVEKHKKHNGDIVETLVFTKDNNDDKNKDNDLKNSMYIEENGEKIDDNSSNTININIRNKNQFKTTKNVLSFINKKSKKENESYKQKLLDKSDDNINMKNQSNATKVILVINSWCFLFSSLSRSTIYFTFKIVHVFFKKYTFEALKYNDEIKFFYFYSIITIAAPSIGSLIGGFICNKYLGGYESKSSIWLVLFFGYLAGIFITLIRVSTDFNLLNFYIFAYFFSVSAFLPTISGYIIHSLHKELKGCGSSIDSLITNVFGKLPGPIVYGLINDKYKNQNPHFAWNLSLAIYYLGLVYISITCMFKWKIGNKKTKLKEKIVEKTVEDVYNLNRSNLIKVKEPVPQEDNKKIEKKGVELDIIKYSTKFFKEEYGNIGEKKKKKSKNKEQKENKEKNAEEPLDFYINGKKYDSLSKKL